MSDTMTAETRANVQPHHDKLNAAIAEVLAELGCLRRHAPAHEKAKWATIEKKVHSIVNHYDRVRKAT